MVDPGSNQTIMWNAYNYEKTTQFNYFKVEGQSQASVVREPTELLNFLTTDG